MAVKLWFSSVTEREWKGERGRGILSMHVYDTFDSVFPPGFSPYRYAAGRKVYGN